MRVLFLFPRPLDNVQSVGGVAEFLCELIPLFKNLKIEPIIYAGFKKIKHIELAKETIIETTVYNGPFIKPNWFASRQVMKNIIAICHKENIDLVHAQGVYLAGFMALQIYKKSKIPYVVTSHGDILPAASNRMKRHRVQKRCIAVLKHAASVTHLTPIMENISHQLFNTKEKSALIDNGINLLHWQLDHFVEKDFMLAIGRLELGKGFHVLIETYAALVKKGVETSLVIAGSGTQELFLHQLTSRLGLPLITNYQECTNFPKKSVIFTGYVRGEIKQRLIKESKLILFATQPDRWEEAFGIVQLEAMAAGKALIASDTLVTRYLQTKGLQCVLVGPTDIQEWGDAICSLLNNITYRQQMGSRNKKAAISFDWKPIAEQYVGVYRSIIGHY